MKEEKSSEEFMKLRFKLQAMENEISDFQLETQRAKSELASEKLGHEIVLSELRYCIVKKKNIQKQIIPSRSRINELKEDHLIESGRARIAGTIKRSHSISPLCFSL